MNISLYEINTRVWLTELSAVLGRPATLDDVPDDALDRVARFGFDCLWLLGAWQTGDLGRSVAITDPETRKELEATLPDLADKEIIGSPYAVKSYSPHSELGGEEALLRFRDRLHQRDLKLMLDFVPNHTAMDHAWVAERPEFYIAGDEERLTAEPRAYGRVTGTDQAILAHGRDPYTAPWFDTFQLNVRHQGCREALASELLRVASFCDAIRVDMAMLLLPDVFVNTWGDASLPADGSDACDEDFWEFALPRLRDQFPDTLLLAEVYWGLEETLQKAGFHATYDKTLYDLLLAQDAGRVREHLVSDLVRQGRCAHFLEDHDELRAARAFPTDGHLAAATICYLAPGLRLFQEGQLKGRRIKQPLHLARRPDEPTAPVVMDFYLRLLEVLKRPEARHGELTLLECEPAWDGNPTCLRFIAFVLEGAERERLLVVVNFGPTQGQCFVRIPNQHLEVGKVLLRDLMGTDWYDRDGKDLLARGLYVDMPQWASHVFQLESL